MTRTCLYTSMAIMLLLGTNGVGPTAAATITAHDQAVMADQVQLGGRPEDNLPKWAGLPYDSTPHASTDTIKFSSPEAAVVGKYVDLLPVNGVAKDSKNSNEFIDYQV